MGTYAAGNAPRAFAVQDFDADGDQDLAVPNADTQQMTLLYNAGDATFSESRSFPVRSGATTANPQGIAAADLDKDGDVDIATANRGTNDVSVLLNYGDGTFLPAVQFAAGNGPVALIAWDLNADTLRDLAVANVNSDNVSVLLNDPLPPFSEDCNGNLVPDSCDIAAGTVQDHNHDGVPDVCQIPGDFNKDLDVDSSDVLAFISCGAGPGIPVPAGCSGKDLDGDGDVDCDDFGIVQRCYSGENVQGNPYCND